MAEEQDILAELEAGEEATAKSKFPIKWVVIGLLVVALGAGGYFGYQMFQKSQMAEEETPAEEKETTTESGAVESAVPQEEATGVMVSLDPFIVNLAGSQGKRFLKVTLTLELNAPEANSEVKENHQKIVDSVLVLLSSKTFEEVYSVQGKFKLKDEITTRVNRFLLMGHIKDVYFTEFVIQ